MLDRTNSAVSRGRQIRMSMKQRHPVGQRHQMLAGHRGQLVGMPG